jgi:hypothetical protein
VPEHECQRHIKEGDNPAGITSHHPPFIGDWWPGRVKNRTGTHSGFRFLNHQNRDPKKRENIESMGIFGGFRVLEDL